MPHFSGIWRSAMFNYMHLGLFLLGLFLGANLGVVLMALLTMVKRSTSSIEVGWDR